MYVHVCDPLYISVLYMPCGMCIAVERPGEQVETGNPVDRRQ